MKAARSAWGAAALLACLWAAPAWAKDEPTFHPKKFENPIRNLNYFEDSDVILFQDVEAGSIWRSPDAGATWDGVKEIPAGEAARLIMHEFDPTRAYVLTDSPTHWRTEDRGKTWTKFSSGAFPSAFQFELMVFHATDPDRIIFNGMDCQSIFCEDVTMYTIDGFKSEATVLRGNTGGCWWAASSNVFSTGEKDLDAQRILCVVRDSFSPFKQDQRLLISDNYFKPKDGKEGPLQEFEPNLDGDRGVQGVVNIAVVRKYILVATTSMNTDEMALFVTDDTKKWHRAIFPTDHKLNQEAYTVLESTDYSIQIDVMDTRPSNPMGVMFTSNSNGTYFTRNIEFTNRNKRGHVDFEKISGVQGIFLVNTVQNGKDVLAKHGVEKDLVSEISFDDGRTFAEIKTADGERIHVHSVTELDNVGRVFSSPAPGLVMANGNVGKTLGAFKDANLYISDDAGVTWIEGPKGPHKYEFGDQGSILVAVKEGEIDEITYSLDHGKTWATSKLPDGIKIKSFILTTTQDSTSLKFMLIGTGKDGYYAIGIDFEGLHEATCKDSDLEDWWARVDKDGNPTCLMGHKQKYQRRKKDAKCFLKKEFKDPELVTEDCECTDADFECDFNFKRDGDECKAVGPVVVPEGACKDAKPEDTFKGSSGWRLIPGNTCRRKSGAQKDDPVERKCGESDAPAKKPMTGKIDNKVTKFSGDWNNFDKYYLERGDSSSADDETIFARPALIKGLDQKGGEIYVTHDHGKTWEVPPALKDEKIWAIIPHSHFKEVVFFVTYTKKVIYTIDAGQHYHEFNAPYEAAMQLGKKPLDFHPDKKDWLIWVGNKCEKGTDQCFVEASISKDRGDNWKTLRRYVSRCEFIGSSAYKFRKMEEILCLSNTKETDDIKNNPLQLVSSSDFFDSFKVREENVREFATMAEFIVVASQNTEKQTLKATTSLDGETYAEAHFPYNFDVPHQHAYTVLDSSTHAVNLFVLTENKDGHRYGSIIKSNSNGTNYVMSMQGVNCNDEFYVDFEKMLGLEGVIMVNTVANRDNIDGKKQLQTRISHNDGSEWAYLPPPAKDVDGKGYSCSGRGDESCALHIHGYTEREDHRKTYSSEGAVGLMFGLGHVGSHLGEYKDADTFMTTDAGLSWKNVKKGVWTWQFGDMGSIIVMVQRHTKTKTVSYTTDEGNTWTDHEFHDSEVEVVDLTTLRSGASRNFVVWAKAGGEVFTINLDFSGLTDRACVQDKDDPNSSKSDYYLWSPEHPLMPNTACLFGHESQYLRKKTDKTCYNGYKLQHLYNTKNCTCTRRDFECDFNFQQNNVGSCDLVPGFEPQSKADFCSANPDAVEFYPPTGYRRIPLTTCEGGKEFDKQNEPESCKGHEDEFERKHAGPGGFVIFLAVVIPFGIAAAVGWWVYNNWHHKFGSIRLGENGSAGGGGFNIDSDSPFVKYPVIALSATFALVGALPLIASALWRTATTAAERWGFGGGSGRGGWTALGGGSRRYTTRDSFARGRGGDAYDIVDEDEGELLGDDSDDEV